jgi:hypothetical protein
VLNHDLGDYPEARVSAFLKRLRQAGNSSDLRAEIRIVAVEVTSPESFWVPAYAEVTIVRPGDLPVGLSATFPRVRALHEVLAVPDFVARFEAARSGDPFDCCGVKLVDHGLSRIGSVQAFSSSNEWSTRPCLVAQGMEVSTPSSPRPLAAPQSPYFDNIGELIRAVNTLPTYYGERDTRNRRFSIIINDYRANFVGYHQDEGKLVIDAAGDELAEARFVGRIVMLNGGLHQVDEPANAEQTVNLMETANHASFSLMASDGEVLDVLQFHLPLPLPLPLTASGSGGENRMLEFVRSLLLMGENASVEFKPWMDLSGEKFEKTLHSVVAMANGNGGDVVVGVDDHGDPAWSMKILGYYISLAKQKLQSKGDVKEGRESETGSEGPPEDFKLRAAEIYARALRDEIQKNINVSPVISVEVVSIDRGIVILMRIEPGPIRPYQDKRTHRTLIRSNATNRSPTAAEIRELCTPRPAR